MKIVLAVLILGFSLSAQSISDPGPGIPRGTGFQAEFLTEFTVTEKYVLDLAERIPQEKYTWRPAEGVRSISEVLLHIAAANYRLPKHIGQAVPGYVVPNSDFERSTTDKAAVLQHLRRSFNHFKAAVSGLQATDGAKKLRYFGNENTYAGFLFYVLRHGAEHTGQLIAYTRFNGIVPPWTEEEQRQRAPALPAK